MSGLLKPISRLLPRVTSVGLRRSFFIYSPDALSPQPDREPTWKKAEEAVQAIQSGQYVTVTVKQLQ